LATSLLSNVYYNGGAASNGTTGVNV
jgi:hypothetical protein